MSGLDVRYELGEGHPLVGRRMPDLEIVTDEGTVRVFALLREARALMLNFGVAGGVDVAPLAKHVLVVDAEYEGKWELPLIGEVPM